MLELQLQLLSMWWAARDTLVERLHNARDDERGDVTAQTAMTMVIVVAAIAAATVIALKIKQNADNVPTPP